MSVIGWFLMLSLRMEHWLLELGVLQAQELFSINSISRLNSAFGSAGDSNEFVSIPGLFLSAYIVAVAALLKDGVWRWVWFLQKIWCKIRMATLINYIVEQTYLGSFLVVMLLLLQLCSDCCLKGLWGLLVSFLCLLKSLLYYTKVFCISCI